MTMPITSIPGTRRIRRAALLVRTVRFDGIPILFSEDVEVINDERYVVSDSGFGALWVIEARRVDCAGNRAGQPQPPRMRIPALAAGPFFPTVKTGAGACHSRCPGVPRRAWGR